MAQQEASLLLKIKSIGEDALSKVVVTLGDLGNIAKKAFEALKEIPALIKELVFEGAQIEQTNRQFEFLAQRAGVAADVLKNDLVGAAKGLADDTDIIEAASRALIKMQVGINELPQLMNLARQATNLFGGNLVDNFDLINNAVATGQTRFLRQIGIIVDTEQAMKNMARSLGVASDSLSQTQKQQATLNAILEQGKTAFKGVDQNANELALSFQRMEVVISQLRESIALLANTALGGFFIEQIKVATEAIKGFNDVIQRNFGSGTEKAKAQLELLERQLAGFKKQLEDFKALGEVPFGETIAAGLEKNIADTQAKIDALNKSRVESHKKANEEISANQSAHDTAMLAKTEEQQIRELTLRNDLIEKKRALYEAETAQEFVARDATATEKELLESEHQQRILEAQLAVNQSQLQATTDFTVQKQLLEDQARIQSEIADNAFNTAQLQNKKKRDDQDLKDRQVFLSTASTLARSNSATLASIGKAAAITEIAIATPKAVASSFAFGSTIGGPPLGFLFAGIASAAMAAQAAQVAGVALAEGGIVQARPGGVQATIGEGGVDEAVIPLDQGRFGNVTIIVNGGLLGDEATARSLAQALDKQLLKLRQNNESVSFSGVI